MVASLCESNRTAKCGARSGGPTWLSQEGGCLECLRQYDPAHVTLERQGLLDDPRYIEGLPADHALRQNENVFGFALGAAGLMVSQFLSLVVQPVGMGNPGAQTYHFATGMMDTDLANTCNVDCPFVAHSGAGDRFPFPLGGAVTVRSSRQITRGAPHGLPYRHIH